MELSIHRAARRVGLALLWLLGSLATAQAATARLVVRPWSASAARVLAGNISRAEYFVDADPGLGNGTAISLTPGADLAGLTFTVNLSTLSNGFHRLSTRTQDVGGVWSLTNTKSFYYQPTTTTTTLANVNKAEYFIDADPGLGSGTNIPVATPSTDVSGLGFVVNLTPLTSGFHRLSTRTRDVNGVWSLTNTKSFYYQTTTTTTTLANVNKAEYFIDADPGLGSGTNIPVATPSTDVSGLAFVVNLTPLTTGFHRLSTRSRDVNGVWSLTNTKSFYYQTTTTVPALANITKAEYFVDAEPGLGNGTNIPVTTPGTNVSGLAFVVNLSTLTDGFHRLSTRTRDANSVWSLTNTKSFYYLPASAVPGPLANITRIEYYLDTDPGFGSATNVPIATPAPDVVNAGYAADLSGLPDGAHRLFIRSRDANGKWSLVSNSAFTKSGCASSVSYTAGLPAASYASVVGGGTASTAFNTDPAAPNTGNSPYFSGGTATLTADLGSAQTFDEVRLKLTAEGPANTTTLLIQTAASTAGPFTTIDTYSQPVGANATVTVARKLTTAATARVLRLSLTNSNPSYNVVLSGAGAFRFNCVTPTITSLTPNMGQVGTTLSIIGANLQGTSVLTFSGTSANTVSSGFTVSANGTSITGVVVPGGAISGNVTATTPNGASNGVNFTVTASPALTSISPTSGLVGSTVTLNGTALTGASVITFAGTSGNTVTSGYAVNAAGTQITGVVVPSGATSGNVTATTPGGTSNGVSFTVTLPGPTLAYLSPVSGPVGTSVIISGTNLSGATSVRFNGTIQTTISSNTATSLVAVVPAGATSGNVTVITPNGTSNGLTFTVTIPIPTLASIAPVSGVVGSTVTLNGANLTGTSTITFAGAANNTVTSGFVVNAAGTQITGIMVPSGAETGSVTATTPGGTTNGVAFTVTLPGPTLANLSPVSGPVGTSVTISGTNLSGATSVSFNGTTQTTIASNTATSLVVTVPTGATSGNVTVITPNGTSNGLAFAVTTAQLVASQSGTLYPSNGTSYGFPSQTSNTTSPAVAFTLSNSGTAPLTISGITATGDFATSGTIPTSVAAGSTGTVSAVFSPTATGPRTGSLVITSNAGTYTLNLSGTGSAPLPTLSSLSPNSGPVGTSVVLAGTDFIGATAVAFNGTNAPGFVVNSAIQITVAVPSGTTSGNVTVTTPGGTTNGVAFTVTVPAPVISNLSPASGPVGTSVTISGTNLSGATSVSFNGTAQTTIASNTATGVIVAVPAGATTGNVTVTTPNGTSNGLTFAVTIPTPAISSFSPAFAKSGQTIIVTGQNLSGATTLSFSGVAQATFSVNAAGTQLTATVPYTGLSTSPDLTSGLIQITTPEGTATSATALRLLAVTAATVSVGATNYPGGLTGDNVSIVGSGFSSASVVYVLNSVSYPVSATVVSETQITAVVPDLSGVSAPSGNGGFTVTNTPGLSGANFEVLSPVVSSLSPTSGPVGTTLTVTGFNFQRNDPRSGALVPTAISGLTIGGVAGTSFQLNSPTQAQMVVPSGTATDFVRTSGGTLQEGVSRGVTFTVSATAPSDLVVSTGTDASPVAVAPGTYNTITITGTGVALLSGTTVVNTTVVVSGTLLTNCQPLTGAASFTLAAGGTLGVCDPAGIAASGATGAVQTTGARSFDSDASYLYNGTAGQTTGTGLPGQVRSLSTTNANAVTLSAPTSVVQVLIVGGAGNLVLNEQGLTLLSSAAGTALVVNSGTGVVSGTATVQRYLDPSQNAGLGYRHYSAPVSNTTVRDLATAGFAPEVSQAATYNSSATPGTTTPFPTVFGYDQSRVMLTNDYAPFDRGFVVPTVLSSPLVVGKGYAVNLNAAQLVDFVGTLNNGDQPLTLGRNPAASTTAADAGWQLVGNPFPAPLNYSLVAPVDRTGLDAGMYVFESRGSYAGIYRAYVNGIGGSPLIGSSQGFFVRVSSDQTSGALTFRNSQRVTSYATQVPVRRGTADTRSLVQVELRGGSGPADVLYAYAETGASSGFDPQYDAVKLPNTTGLNLSSVASTSEALTIDGRAAFSTATVLPLTIGVPSAGTYTLTAATLTNLPAGLDTWLIDALTGQAVNLRQQPRYAFAVTMSQAAALITGRFSVVFRAGALAATTGLTATAVTLYPNPAHDAFTVLVPGVAGATALQAELLNALGQVVLRQTAALPAAGVQLHVPTAKLAQGVYLLRLQAGESIVTKRVIVQ